ncbi:hypothetical protein FRC10_003509 [Ceratobasidium sp. 414]|nr:hypothetical protein FRC10_003509 [Ceratobasidium sp. 414]
MIYWLNGLAGTGKTTIAYSFCEKLESASKLAASFFCSRHLPACRDVKRILPSISYQLSSISRPFRCAVSSALEDLEVHNLPFFEQLDKLVTKPLLKVKHTLPANLVVVIDALDECEDDADVNRILGVLLRCASDLPVKFFITSRPSPTILIRMRSKWDEHVLFELRLHEVDRSADRDDIRTYLATALQPANLPESDITSLVQRSGLIFIFAATIVSYIGHDNFSQSVERLNHMLIAPIPSANEDNQNIDLLYTSILQERFDNTDLKPSKKDEMALVLHSVVCAQEPLTVDMLASMSNFDGAGVDNALLLLQPLLQTSDTSGLVTTLHGSFQDYLLDQQRSDRFYCDAKKHHARLAQVCFDLIAVPSPPFNICKLESSYLRDREVPNIDRRVKEVVSPELLYACRYWGVHLGLARESEDLLNRLHDFLATRLLLWMEILNLNRFMDTAASQLYRLHTWLKDVNGSATIQDLAHDAWKFVAVFSSNPTRDSTPHIYVSMIPFWPERSPLSTHYTPGVLAGVKATGAGMRQREWAALTALPSAGRVTCVAYSPDNAHIVSASLDKTIRIWDAHIGQSVGQPLEGHTNSVNSVAYSPDGAYIISGSRDTTIRIWDTHLGQSVGQPLEGHIRSVCSVVYSPNGAYIASGSFDCTIRIWEACTGQSVGQPLKGHEKTVYSVAYSPNGAHIVSGSEDETIRIWDAHAGQSVGQPLKGHISSVRSVSYSPNGAYIVSGSDDETICIWNAHTGQPVGQPLKGHTSSVWSVTYSPNGAYIVSSSLDNSIRIWDAHTGQSLEGHTGSVISVAYSPNGAYIVSGSEDNIIRIWDAHTGQSVGQPLEGHTRSVSSVAYSPNGAYIVSGSGDNTIRIWDAHTGQSVGQPLEGHTRLVNSIVFSPNGAYIVSGSLDNTIRIWDAHTEQCVGQPLEGHTQSVNSVAYSPNGAYIVSGSRDNTIRLWDAHTGQPVGHPLEGHTQSVSSVAYSPNGAYIVSGSGDHTIRIWDAHTGHPVGQPLEGHTKWVWSVAYSPNGAYVVSGSEDNTIRIWDAHNGRSVGQPLVGHTKPVHSVAYSPNGAYIVSGSSDKTIRIWDTPQTDTLGPPAEVSTVHSVTSSGSKNPLPRPARSIPPIFTTVTDRNTEHTPNEVRKLLDDWTLDGQGWIVNATQDRLVWVPHDMRDVLPRPPSAAVISPYGSIRLDFNNAKLGKEWARCFDSKQVPKVN